MDSKREPILPSSLRADLFGRERPDSLAGLRVALLGEEPAGDPSRRARSRRKPPGPPRRQPRGVSARPAVPAEVGILVEAPAARRLCESYHRARGQLVARGRRQRMGIAALVAALGTVIVPMVEQQRVTAGGGRLAVVCLAMTAATAVAVLAALLGRELRVLTSNQGDRLVRGLHLSGLAASALEPIGHDPVHGFQAVYAAWRQVGHRLAEA